MRTHVSRRPFSASRRAPGARSLPTGTITFLLTDVEGSTARWQQTGDAFKGALAGHHQLLRRVFGEHGGHEVKEAGDSFLVAFASASEAVACAIAAQCALAAHPWPSAVGPLSVRMALHSGDVNLDDGEYRGLPLHHAARLIAAA